MSLLLRRGLETDRLSFTPEEGELIYVTDTKLIYVGDGVTAGGNLLSGGTAPTTPTYALTRSSATVNEGASVTITLTTTNVNNGTSVPYTITGTGITAADLGLASLTGSFIVSSNSASLVIAVANDFTTEGLETFTVTLNSIIPAVAVSVGITDSSTSVIDGGGPSTTVFDIVLDGGSPGSTFTVIIDGGTP